MALDLPEVAHLDLNVANEHEAFVGIDVAFAAGKRLPVCVLTPVPAGDTLVLPLRARFAPPPAGQGNALALDPDVRREFAGEVLDWLRRVEQEFGVRIRRIAIDAPSDYCRTSSGRRVSEQCLDRAGISCFATPTEAAFENKVRQSREFLAAGGPVNRLPNANQIWMLIGFELFRVLGEHYECIETYPQAILRGFGCADQHKSTETGLQRQYEAAAMLLGVEPAALMAQLQRATFGAAHDRLDAFLSAWVATLDEGQRHAHGTPPADAIWVPAAAPSGDKMNQQQQIVAQLDKAGEPLCDACLRSRTGIGTHQAVNQITRKLAEAGLTLRATAPCSGCGKDAMCSIADVNLLPTEPASVDADDTATLPPWYWEGNVQAAVVEWLKLQGWEIIQAVDTAAKTPGIDIIARRVPDKELWVTVKGFPRKSKYVQARHWFAGGIFDLVNYRGKSAQAYLAFALPDGFPTYAGLATKSAWLKQTMPFTIFWLSADGTVRSE